MAHRGGYDGFSFDITDFLTAPSDPRGQAQVLFVDVWDPTEAADGVPLGKQRAHVTPLKPPGRDCWANLH